MQKEKAYLAQPNYMPLTMGQKIMYVSQKFCMRKSVVDICTMLHFDCEMDPRLLMQAIQLGITRNESSFVRLHKVGKEIMQYIYQGAAEPIIVMDYTGKTEEELNTDLEKWSKVPFPHGSMDCQLYRCRFIKKPNGFYGVYFCVSHLAFDAYALMMMASDIAAIYVALRDGTALPVYKGDYVKLCQQDIARQSSEKYKQDVDYFVKEVFGTQEPYGVRICPARQKRVKGTPRIQSMDILHADAYHVNCKIPAALNQRINEQAAKMRISPLSFYLLGVRSYLSSVNEKTQDVMFPLAAARRATLLEKRSGGTRVLANNIRMQFDGKIPIHQAIAGIAEKEAATLKHMNIVLTDADDQFRKNNGIPIDLTGFYCMSMTYNPYSVILPEGIKAHLTLHCTGAQSQATYLSIMALDDSGDLVANYDCKKAQVEPGTAEKMHAYMLKSITYALDHPDDALETLSNL